MQYRVAKFVRITNLVAAEKQIARRFVALPCSSGKEEVQPVPDGFEVAVRTVGRTLMRSRRTSWAATLIPASQPATLWMMLSVMALGLFMNASLTQAFTGSGWVFVVPFLVTQLGGTVWTIAHAPDESDRAALPGLTQFARRSFSSLS